jgi:acetyl-CoA C-acetyltransferase
MGRVADTPVIVGIGFHQERSENPLECSEPYRSMVEAVHRAAEDAGRDDLVRHLDSVSVPRGLWHYRNPARLVAEALGCPAARTAIADLGVLQLTLLSDLCRAIAAGEQAIGVVTGGEAQFRELRAMIARTPVADTDDTNGPPPDVHLTSPDPFCSELEERRGIQSPTEYFAIIESALRHDRGLGLEQHRDELAALYASFSRIAAENPHAWRRESLSAAEIRDASPRNAMIAFPYTKRHCSYFNVNQSVAILVCSLEKAESLGLDAARWIFPLSGAQSRHVVSLAEKRRLHRHPGTVIAGKRALELAGASAADVAAAELYSCFPAAIQCFARDLELREDRPWTVTGAMPYAGGPFNHASLEGVARMVEVLRAKRVEDASGRHVGLVSNLSGIFGKQACAVFADGPGQAGYGFADVTAEVAHVDPPVALDGDYVGAATIAGYTVVFQQGEPAHAVAVCDTKDGRRTVVRSEDRALLEAMMREEFVGRVVRADVASFSV